MTDSEKVEYVVVYHIEDGYLVGDRLKERVTRCRDCRFYSEREMRDFNTQKPVGTDCCCERNEYVVDVEPDGFCKWAERRTRR